MDGTSNSVITQTLDLPICFPTGETQTLSFLVTLMDQGCTIVLGYRWLTQYNPSIDWVLGHIQFRQMSQHESKTSPSTETELSSVPLTSVITPTQPLLPVTPHKPRVTPIMLPHIHMHANLKVHSVFNYGSPSLRSQVVQPRPAQLT